jgi:hypothetical protein
MVFEILAFEMQHLDSYRNLTTYHPTSSEVLHSFRCYGQDTGQDRLSSEAVPPAGSYTAAWQTHAHQGACSYPRGKLSVKIF